MTLFTYFFNSGLDDQKRWQFIEDYFLGEDATTLIETYSKFSGHNHLDYVDGLN